MNDYEKRQQMDNLTKAYLLKKKNERQENEGVKHVLDQGS